MKKIYIAMMFFGIVWTAQANVIFFEGFDDSSGIIISGNASYWGIAPLEGTSSIPSGFIQGGSQSGNIFYGSNGYDSTATMTINLPDLTGYTDLRLILSLAAPDGTRWENTHRDSLIISGTSGVIDSFLPYLRGSPLRSQLFLIDLHYYFQDFEYIIDSSLESLTFNFASTSGNEVIGIDSVTITGTPPVTASVDFNPKILNKKSKGNYVTCYIELPEDYNVEEIDINTITLNVNTLSIIEELSKAGIGDYNRNEIPDLLVKFYRHSIQDACETGAVEMTISFQTYDGTIFEGSDTIFVIDEGKGHNSENQGSVHIK